MSKNESIIERALEKMSKAGFDRAECSLTRSQKHELGVEHGAVTMARTMTDVSLSLTGISQSRRASTIINQVHGDAVDAAVEQLVAMASGAPPDEAHDIAPHQPTERFESGPRQANLDAMYDRLVEFTQYVSQNHPTVLMSEAPMTFNFTHETLANSNGVHFEVHKGKYDFYALFSAKEGSQASSFNYSVASTKALDRPLHEMAGFAQLLDESARSIKTSTVPKKFVGDIIVTPWAMDMVTGFVSSALQDQSIIAETSIYSEQVGQQIAHPSVTLRSRPTSRDEVVGGYFFTGDGIKAADQTLIESGVLKGTLLGLYGANKTGRPRAVNTGGCYAIEPGDVELEALIAGVERGVILGRFSGGRPAANGDFSGIAKNSWYVENGQVKYPLGETMISGNLASMLREVTGISRQTLDFGDNRYPWLRVGGVTVS